MTTPSDQPDLTEIAEAIADAAPVEWPEATEVDTAALASRLAGLRRLEAVATAYRELHQRTTTSMHVVPDVSRPEPQFRWRHLEVFELLGQGSFGEVYRAFDPMLDREVALKLRREEEPGRRDLVVEARRLARIRHPHVVTVHGVDEHDGRIGLWTDLISGHTLTDFIRQHGPFGPREAAAAGIELCGALAAVHGAGLVHGDVKPSNIMRERGGRIVLMDFGAGIDLRATGGQPASPSCGTPIVMPPELLAGAAARPITDIYSLGVVLYFMVTGHYPIEASCLTELLAKKGIGDEVAISDHRPDLPAALVAVIGRATASDPTKRYPTAGSLRSALAEYLGDTPADGREVETETPSDSGPPQLTTGHQARWLLVAALLILGAVAAGLPFLGRAPTGSRSAAPPVASSAVNTGQLRLAATLYRDGKDHAAPLTDGDMIRPGDRLFLEIENEEPVYLYVLNEDLLGHVYLLFPVAGLELSNPLPPHRQHRVPGATRREEQDWVVTSAGGKERFMVVAARRQLPEVEQLVAGIVPVDRSRIVSDGGPGAAELGVLRGIGGLADATTGPSRLAFIRDRLTILLKDEPMWVNEVVLDNPRP